MAKPAATKPGDTDQMDLDQQADTELQRLQKQVCT